MDLVFPTINLNILSCHPSTFFRSQPTDPIFFGGVLAFFPLTSCCDVCCSILFSQIHLVLDCWLLCGSYFDQKKKPLLYFCTLARISIDCTLRNRGHDQRLRYIGCHQLFSLCGVYCYNSVSFRKIRFIFSIIDSREFALGWYF